MENKETGGCDVKGYAQVPGVAMGQLHKSVSAMARP